MGEMPSSGGGSSALYKDGDPVNVVVGNSETITVPDGETWVVTVVFSNGDDAESSTQVAGSQYTLTAPSGDSRSAQFVLKGGDEVGGHSGSTDVNISGWSV